MSGTLADRRVDAHGRAPPGRPGPRGAGDRGTRNGGGILDVRVTTVAAESVLARLQRLVEEAQRDKAPLQRFADRISAVFVPAVLLGACRSRSRSGGWSPGTSDGPCCRRWRSSWWRARAPWVATPVAMMVGFGRASSLGIFDPQRDALERLARVDPVVFDNTGTLTERFAEVTESSPWAGARPATVMALAAAVESRATTPSPRPYCYAAPRRGGDGFRPHGHEPP